MSAAIRARGLRRVFGDTIAVAQLDIDVAGGEIFGLVGPDGAGKTTTMRMLAGILEPSAGEAEVAGCDVRRDAEKLKERIGYMSQRFGLYADLTVVENLEFYADIYGVSRRERAEKMDRLLGFSNLTPFRRRLAGNLSGGMKQKLGLACALIHTPEVLLLDEPTNGVDPVSRRDFWRILYQLVREGVTIFVSTAYLDEAERCNRLALLHRGAVLAQGAPADVKAMLPGALLGVRAARPRRAAARLREQLPSAAVNVFGERIHVSSAGGREPLEAEIRRALVDPEFQPVEVNAIEPSLEDVFVAVVARQGAGESAGRS